MRVLLLMLLLLPQLAAARVYICVDEITGKTSFSDRGCQTTASQEEVRVQAINVGSGSRTAGVVAQKTWVSDRDVRKTGLDYNAGQRSINKNNATASTSTITESDDS